MTLGPPEGPRPREPMGPIMPAGMPPGTAYPSEERAPEAVIYFRIFAGVFVAFYGLIVLGGAGLVVAPALLSRASAPPPGADIALYVTGLIYGGVGLAHVVPGTIALFAGRRPWAHTLGTVVIALAMFNLCCIPVLIPLLIVWMKPETRRWYGVT